MLKYKVQLDILNSIFGCFGVGGQESALPPAEFILSESQPKVHFKIRISNQTRSVKKSRNYHDSLLYNQIELWNLLVSFSLLSLPKVPNFGEFQNEFENQYLIVQVTTDFGFQNNYFLLVSESESKKNWKPAWLWMIFQSRFDTGWKFLLPIDESGFQNYIKNRQN